MCFNDRLGCGVGLAAELAEVRTAEQRFIWSSSKILEKSQIGPGEVGTRSGKIARFSETSHHISNTVPSFHHC